VILKFPIILEWQYKDTTIRRGNSITYSGGVAQETFFPDETIKASVQPISGAELQRLFPGGEVVDAIVVFCREPLQPGQEGQKPADRVLFNGKTYVVTQVQRWEMGQLNHTRAIAIAER
jgi:hypothetical protein